LLSQEPGQRKNWLQKAGWNFLSEEFLESIGSQYQDFFQIVVKDKNGTAILIDDVSVH